MTTTYLFGYSGRRYTLEQLNTFETWNKVHPEIRRRVIAMVDMARSLGYDLGIGNGWRSETVQRNTFLNRYVVVPCDGSYNVRWEGKCWKLKPGMAPAAPPGNSYHESTDPLGYALAVDLLNYQPAIGWAVANDTQFHLKDFGQINAEPWHYQPIEIPNSRRNYNPSIHTLKHPPMPSKPFKSPWPPAPLKPGDRGENVKTLQYWLNDWKKNPGPIDGIYGPQTTEAVKRGQAEVKASGIADPGPIDGLYGSKTKAAFDAYYKAKGWSL